MRATAFEAQADSTSSSSKPGVPFSLTVGLGSLSMAWSTPTDQPASRPPTFTPSAGSTMERL